ncbi:hypothetical protein VHEMI08620 [[Torrubiella] hemipterigena]|uniref:Alginate lyase domain-containing protein n=1 Tax=[Torrubiella] hemipterigena TaxID=1531966 RepID=A0A0A1TE07_9HYPO|nr:hypothetical protein VHEMI08620 [[Torrubiella] hemipterigena]
MHTLILSVFVSATASLCSPNASGPTVTSFDGAVTGDELNSFNSYVESLSPAKDNIGNQWAQGDSGERTKAMGVVYQIARQRRTLDNMLVYCDAVLSQRNDLAPAPIGQHKAWTGDIAPVWPNNIDSEPVSTGGEQGDPVGHLASCANLILQTKDIHHENTTGGDAHGYGATYLDRAKTYLKQGDFAMTNHILPRLLNISNGDRMYFASDSPYKGGQAVPWNQQMMFNYAFQNLVEAHLILGDDAELADKYKGIMQTSLSWFFSGGGSVTKKSKRGNPIYTWMYAPDTRDVEDSNHASLDVAGFYRAWSQGSWGITKKEMEPFANVLVDVMSLGGGQYAGTVEGSCGEKHKACTNYIRSGMLWLSEFRPDQYKAIMGADLQEGKSTPKVDIFSRFLWVKNLRAQQRA